MFEYDVEAPLEYEEHSCERQNGVNVCEVSYASPHGGRVSALLLVPDNEPPLAGILFMHPSGTDRYAFLKEASIFSQGGCVALLIDAPYARQPIRPVFSFTERDRNDLIQATVDLRRGVDLLLERPEVDADRIGCIGFSYGASVVAMLAGAEARVKAYILWASSSNLTDFLRGQAKSLPQDKLEVFLDAMKVIDPIHHVGHAAPSSLLFQNGLHDKNAPEKDVTALFETAREPKQMAWYDAGHHLDGKACQDRYLWMREQLKLDLLQPDLMMELGKFKLKQMVRPK
ncbi:alpha/beta hydrolase family protein [Acidobacteriota bacterium]